MTGNLRWPEKRHIYMVRPGAAVELGARGSAAPVLPRARGDFICAARKGLGLVQEDIEQTTGDGRESIRFSADRAQARQQKAEGIVERIIHRPHARLGFPPQLHRLPP